MISRLRRSQAGIGLAEILVVMALTGVLTSLVVMGMMAFHRSYRYVDQDQDALGRLRTAVDRVEKELRQARRIYPGSTARRLHVWVDYDRDNQQDLDERIIWELETVSEVGHLTRTTEAGGDKRTLVRDLVPEDAFVYDATPPESSSLVTMALSTDGTSEADGPKVRTVETEVNLRNAVKD